MVRVANMNALYSYGVVVVSALIYFQQAYSFQSISFTTTGRTSTINLYATVLTPRQRQFWEDVECKSSYFNRLCSGICCVHRKIYTFSLYVMLLLYI